MEPPQPQTDSEGPVRAEYQRLADGVAPVDRREVLRYLGYPARVVPPAWLEPLLDRWIAEAVRRARPRVTWGEWGVLGISARRLELAGPSGPVVFTGAIGEFLGMARRIVAFVATAGPEVEHLASELLAGGEALLALIVNAVGSERAEAAEAAMIAQVRSTAAPWGLAPTLPYSPGYCGMALSEQRTLFSLFAGEDVGVCLSADCLMNPLKSVSGLVGLGPVEAVRQFGSPCERCDIQRCAMRRSA